MSSIKAEGFNHVAIWVSDVRKSADWYIDNLGLEEYVLRRIASFCD